MKNIVSYNPTKYNDTSLYSSVDDGIFEYNNPPDAVIEQSDGVKYQYGLMTTSRLESKYYVTSLTFEQEPELGEGTTPDLISQYPLEYILDTFNIWVSDFYSDENNKSEKTCYLEFGSSKIERLKELRTIIGKHVYGYTSKEGKIQADLIIE